MARGETRPRVVLDWPRSYTDIALRLLLGKDKKTIMEELGMSDVAYDRRKARIREACLKALEEEPVPEKKRKSEIGKIVDLLEKVLEMAKEESNHVE